MKQQMVLTHQNTVLREAEKKLTGPQKTSMLCFYETIRTSINIVDTTF
jgi:hypothetical protein